MSQTNISENFSSAEQRLDEKETLESLQKNIDKVLKFFEMKGKVLSDESQTSEQSKDKLSSEERMTLAIDLIMRHFEDKGPEFEEFIHRSSKEAPNINQRFDMLFHLLVFDTTMLVSEMVAKKTSELARMANMRLNMTPEEAAVIDEKIQKYRAELRQMDEYLEILTSKE